MFAWVNSLWKWLTSRPVVRVLLWILHFVVLAAVLVGLWWVNRRYRIETDLLSPFPRLHPFWLPLLLLLVYAGAWLGYWFFRLLTDPADGEHPDIDDAWAEGLAALDRAGIDPTEVPLFLVVGKPAGGAADFFAAIRLPLAVRDEPRRPDAPVKVFASRGAVFVTCEGASVLSTLADQLATRRPSEATPPVPQPARRPAGLEETSFGVPDLLDSRSTPAAVTAGEPGPAAGPAASPKSADYIDLEDWLPTPGTAEVRAVSADETARQSARLRYLCRRIADRRRPFCSANGVLWLVPVAGTEDETVADQTAAAVRADFAAVRDGLQVECPSAAVVCDAQELTGFRDLLRGLPDSLGRERLVGRSFPLVPHVPADSRPDVWKSGIDWLARHLLPGVVYQRFGSEAEGNGERWSAANARVWQLAAEVYARRAAVARVVGQSLADDPDRPPLLAGVYLAGTGADERDQAFAAGVVRQLIALQNHVRWTAAAVAEEADYRRMTAIGYAATFLLVLGVGYFAWAAWMQ